MPDDLSFHRKDDILIAKAHANNVKVLVSIGGGSASGNKTLKARYFDLLSEPKRAEFAAKLAAYVADHGFDGLDVDIEGPSINKDYGAFIRELSAALKPRGKLLTAALSQGYGGKSVPDSVFEHFDFVNVMAYDGAGSWNPNAPGQHSSMEFARKNVDYWLKRGLPASKTVLGVPFYGYGFGKAFRKSPYSYQGHRRGLSRRRQGGPGRGDHLVQRRGDDRGQDEIRHRSQAGGDHDLVARQRRQRREVPAGGHRADLSGQHKWPFVIAGGRGSGRAAWAFAFQQACCPPGSSKVLQASMRLKRSLRVIGRATLAILARDWLVWPMICFIKSRASSSEAFPCPP